MAAQGQVYQVWLYLVTYFGVVYCSCVMCICRLTQDLCGELFGLILSLVRSLQPVLLIGLLQSGKRYVSTGFVLFPSDILI